MLSALMPSALMVGFSGCLSAPPISGVPERVNAVQVSADQYDVMWERAVAVLNDRHFMVARESKVEGVIETHWRAGSNLFEPWHQDSVGYQNRLESTLQSIRRRVVIAFQTVSPGSVMISVRVDKEIEDVPPSVGIDGTGVTAPVLSAGRTGRDQISGQPGISRWLPRGTDPALEAELLHQIRHATLR
ncbi:MAG: hypothetical protein RIK87_03475 [Fuerstiella sp.]